MGISPNSIPVGAVVFPVSKQVETFQAYQWNPQVLGDENVIISKNEKGLVYFLGTSQIFSGDYVLISDWDGHMEICSQTLFGVKFK